MPQLKNGNSMPSLAGHSFPSTEFEESAALASRGTTWSFEESTGLSAKESTSSVLTEIEARLGSHESPEASTGGARMSTQTQQTQKSGRARLSTQATVRQFLNTSKELDLQTGPSSKTLLSPSSFSWSSLSLTFKSKYDFELKDLNFKELTQRRYGDACEWKDLSTAERVPLIREALKTKKVLIDPSSDYMKMWDIVIVVSLLFTAVVTPYEIAFLVSYGNLALWYVNRGIDLVFVKDMIMQFYIKVKKKTKQSTVWVTDRRAIAEMYLKSWFTVDVLSIIPYDDICYYFIEDQSRALSNLKVMRLLRALRLFKLIRIVKASRVFKRWENRMSMRYSNKCLCKFTMLIAVSCHWMACIWGFCGVLEGGNMICREDLRTQDPTDQRLSSYPHRRYFFLTEESSEPYNPNSWLGESWLVRFANSRAAQTPTNPCSPEVLYLVSVYWAVMTITSIGYGDIIPITVIEYAICALCMMMSSIVWAYIIGAACATMSTMDPETSEFEMRLDAFNAMAKDEGLPQHVRYRGREYLREECFHKHQMRNREAIHTLGTELKCVVSKHVACHILDNIWFFRRVSAEFRQDVTDRFLPLFYEKRVLINLPGRLCVVDRGAVGRGGRILVPGAYWGDEMLVRDKELWSNQVSVSLAYTEIMALTREDLSAVLVVNPHDVRVVRRAAATVELARIAHIYCNQNEDRKNDAQYEWISRLFAGMKSESKRRVANYNESDNKQPPLGEPVQGTHDQLRCIESMLQRLIKEREDSDVNIRKVEENQSRMQSQLNRIEHVLKALSESKS